MVVWGNLTTFARALKEGERVYVSGELRYRGCDKEAVRKDTVKIPVVEIHAEIRRLDPKAAQNGEALPER